jgi:enamine deaminase RidA (YjgF/YER057c/UK114 family)
MTPEERLHALGLELPEIKAPDGGRIRMRFARRTGNLLYLSGNGPMRDGTPAFQGKLGADVSLEQGYEAARLTALNLLSVIRLELGSLDRVAGFVKTLGFVSSAPGFHQQPLVLNGFADLIVDVFGEERGLHARSAVGVVELPWNIPVEIETIVEVGV